MRVQSIRRRKQRPAEAPYDIQGVGKAFCAALLVGALMWAALIATVSEIF